MCLIAAIVNNEEQITLIAEGTAPDLFPVDKADFSELVARFDALDLAHRLAICERKANYCGRTRRAVVAKNGARHEEKHEYRAPKRTLLMAQVA